MPIVINLNYLGLKSSNGGEFPLPIPRHASILDYDLSKRVIFKVTGERVAWRKRVAKEELKRRMKDVPPASDPAIEREIQDDWNPALRRMSSTSTWEMGALQCGHILLPVFINCGGKAEE